MPKEPHKHLMEVARECQAKDKSGVNFHTNNLTRDETHQAIGYIKGELRWLFTEITELKEILRPIEERYAHLANEKFRLEMSVEKVKVVGIRVHKPDPETIALQAEIDELIKDFSPEELTTAKERGLLT